MPHHQSTSGPNHNTSYEPATTAPPTATSPSSNNTPQGTVRTAERSIRTAQRNIRTAEKTSAAATKSVQEGAKATEKSIEATAKASVKAKQILQATAEATAKGLKAAAETTVKAVKAIIEGIKSLIAAIASGGWVAVVVIVVILLVALIAGSAFGIFFAGEDTGSPMTIQQVVSEINRDYSDKIESIENRVPHDELDTTGSMASWPEILALYAVKLNTDPTNPMEVVTMDSTKQALLEGIFWDMNPIEYRTTSRTEITYEEVIDEEGNPQTVEIPITITTLHIHTAKKLLNK